MQFRCRHSASYWILSIPSGTSNAHGQSHQACRQDWAQLLEKFRYGTQNGAVWRFHRWWFDWVVPGFVQWQNERGRNWFAGNWLLMSSLVFFIWPRFLCLLDGWWQWNEEGSNSGRYNQADRRSNSHSLILLSLIFDSFVLCETVCWSQYTEMFMLLLLQFSLRFLAVFFFFLPASFLTGFRDTTSVFNLKRRTLIEKQGNILLFSCWTLTAQIRIQTTWERRFNDFFFFQSIYHFLTGLVRFSSN